ncbi:MAG: ATP-binding protein [Firmicutes bacterium]|nr:ATP-binding protein [Bacillota bacterium]
MDITNLSYLYSLSVRRVRDVPMKFSRRLLHKIDWENRLISLRGARGTGKTTLLLQHIKTSFSDPQQALYLSLDHLWFKTHSVYDSVEAHVLNGGTHVFLDEVHYQEHWETLIKTLYDDFPMLHIVYTGSSILKLYKAQADLSRRQAEYVLPGLSFSEYLELEGLVKIPEIPLDELLSDHVRKAMELTEGISIIKSFYQYLQSGYYPFYKDVHSGYDERILQIINQILESDYPAVENISNATIRKIKKMLMILAENAPQTPNMSRLYTELETDRNQGLKMLKTLETADLLNLLSSDSESLKNMSRPDKIYCDNPNIMYALCPNAEIGCIRETFFLNQLRAAGHQVVYPKQGDFLIDGRYLFEVGGKRKSFEQIKDLADSYLAVDDTQIGSGHRIPLWMFGLLY